MEHETAITGLTPAYAEALRLRAEGCAPAEIAERLGVGVEVVPALVYLAEAKWARLAHVGRVPGDVGNASAP